MKYKYKEYKEISICYNLKGKKWQVSLKSYGSPPPKG